MASAQFSEFSFGFAYGREVVSKHWAALKSAPILPSLYDEGKDGGFDLAIGLYGWTYFAQFKRSDYLSRANATWWLDHSGSYYRFPITRRRHSRQHDLLLRLEQQNVFHIVEYVAPRFYTSAELSSNFIAHTVIDRSLRLFPRSVGPIVDDQQHYVTFTAGGSPVVRSEPIPISTPFNAGDLSEWQPANGEEEPVRFDAEQFDTISAKLLVVAQQVGVQTRGLADGLANLSPFGRARTLGRLLAGAELLPLVVGQEAEQQPAE